MKRSERMIPMIISGIIFLILLLYRCSLGFQIPPPDLELGVSTAIGDREIQADSFDYAYTNAGFLLVLADGVGSGEKGKIAASIAVDTCRVQFEQMQHFDNPGFFFGKAFRTANHDILEIIDDGTAGANLLCAVISDGLLYYALSGNCRLFVFREGDLVPLSEGHTIDMLAKQSFQKGRISRQDALAALKERRIYNFVGQDGFHEIEFYDTPVELRIGDVVVLLTDGIEDIFGLGKLEKILKTQRSCEDIAFTVTDTIQNDRYREDRDNGTIILLRINGNH